MVIAICPRCGQRYSHQSYDTDYVHNCSSGRAQIDNEDVFKIGDYEDEVTGQTVKVPNAMMQGAASKAGGLIAGIENIDSYTTRGNRASTHRQRKHYQYVKLK